MPEPHSRSGPHQFCTTRWSMVLNAKNSFSSQSVEALESLCQSYWYPLYSFVRRKGHSAQDAEDLVQGFFEQFLSRDYLRAVERDKGKFRTFLLTSLTHFLANEWDKKNRLKRGGGLSFLSMDGGNAETRFKTEPADFGTPDLAFERIWAETVVEIALGKLEQEYAGLGEARRFAALKPFLMGDGEVRYQELGPSLGLSEGGMKTAVRRLRLRFRALLCQELAQTLVEGADVNEEMRHMLQALTRSA